MDVTECSETRNEITLRKCGFFFSIPIFRPVKVLYEAQQMVPRVGTKSFILYAYC